MDLKAIVIEDELIIRKGIIQKVQWHKFNISRILEASNGEMGYNIIIEEKPEIILLDVNLPKMDGLELLKKIREDGITSKVMILSGHDEFTYAQKAIEYGVENYLLKPSSATEIEEVLEKICDNIIKEQEKDSRYEEMKKKLKDMIPFFRSGLINKILSGEIKNKEEILGASAYLGLNLTNEFFMVAVFIMENGFRDNKTSKDPEAKFIKELGMHELVSMIDDPGRVIVESHLYDKAILIISGRDEASTRKYCFSLIDELMKRISKEISSDVVVGIGEVKNNILQISQSYSEALAALEERFIDSSSKIFYIGDTTLQNSDTSDYPYEDEKKFMQSVKIGQQENSLVSLKAIIGYFKVKKEKYPVALAKIQLKRITYYLIQVAYEFEADITEFTDKIDIYEQIESFTTIDEYERFITEFTIKLCAYISKKRYVKHTATIRKAIIYIEQNYNDENLSLDKIADHVGMHPNYISHLFKKEKGESLSSYICRYRIKKAEELILKNQSLKMYDVAYEVGFNDPNYFATCFKNIIGVSPTEYRQLNAHNS
ncbi:MAG TPA: response regulator [Clostridiaceae bacterium]|nr:response regulator [Clostridiaceae bacterium]